MKLKMALPTLSKIESRLLNLGCGQHFHSEWINLDFNSQDQSVIKHDLLRGIPFSDNYFEAVYHSHVLEHFSMVDGEKLIKECFRVLKKGGICRVVVPDLEKIAKEYLSWLEKALTGDKLAEVNYDWIILELLDQMTRNFGGGEMGKYLTQEKIFNEDFVRGRIGDFFDKIRKNDQQLVSVNEKFSLKGFIKNLPILKSFLEIKRNLQKKIVLKRFASSGELHLWMYDRFSLARLLQKVGFKNIKVCRAEESRIPDWQRFELDVDKSGKIYKADSLYLEAEK